MNNERYRKLGDEKEKDFNKNFDELYEKYLKKAKKEGLTGDLRFERERGRVLIFIKLFEYKK